MRRDDWLLAQLPQAMVADRFFRGFVSIFQTVATTLVDGADNVEHMADPAVAPEPMVRWLASWIGLDAIDPALPVPVQRGTVLAGARTHGARGTRPGLLGLLAVMGNAAPAVSDSGGVYRTGACPAADRPALTVRVETTGALSEADFVALVRDHVPVHVAATVLVGDRQVWPPA
ncbi:MAG TPA: phage tail protein [Frankiaceae bacterium]|nr:phage tail protein [Frankiaceae bacterium]